MEHVVVLTFYFANDFVVQVVDRVIISRQTERAFLAVKVYAYFLAFKAVRIAALPIPGDRFVAEVEVDDIDVGRLPIVLEVVAVSAADNPIGQVHLQSPAGKVQEVNAIVAKFPGAPVPKPMPIVMDNVVAVRLFRRRALPHGIVKPTRDGSGFSVAD